MFLKNINALKKHNLNLAIKLEQISFDKAREVIDIGYAKNQDVIFIKNNTPLESIENPVEDTFYNMQEHIKTNLEKFDFLLMFGLGVGYMLDYAFEKYESRLLVLEPDINVLRVAFEMVDYSKYLDTGRVFITDKPEDIYDFISDKYIVNDRIEIVLLKSYVNMYSEQIKDFSQKIYDTCIVKMVDINTIKNNSEQWVYSSLDYVKVCGQTYPISLLDNQFEGKTALVLGAGPSLKENIQNIKKYRDRYVIFAVNRALLYLASQEVIPDFGVFTDTRSIQSNVNNQVSNLKEINFISDIKVDPYVYSLIKKRCFTYFPENYDLAVTLSKKIPQIKLYPTAGTATFCALISAKNLGFKNIILCGCDLAFKNNEPYCYKTDTIVNEKEIQQGSLIKKIVQVKSVSGKMVDSREDYAIFVKQFEKFFAQNPHLKVYNVTSFGAQIEGTINLPLELVIEQIHLPFELKSTEDIISDVLYSTEYNPLGLKKIAKEVVQYEQKENFEIRGLIKNLFEEDLDNDLFFNKAAFLIDKISKTILLSQLLQFEILACTKILIQKDIVLKRAKIEMFLETVIEKVEVLGQKLITI